MNTIDEYTAESEIFRVLNYDIEVKDELLGEALKYLPKKKRDATTNIVTAASARVLT